MENLKIVWDGEPTDEQYDRVTEIQVILERDLGLALELIGTRPKSRG